jgi:hypothetical protein
MLSHCNYLDSNSNQYHLHFFFISTDGPTGSDLVLEAVLEAEVAENAKLFVSQPHDQLPKE